MELHLVEQRLIGLRFLNAPFFIVTAIAKLLTKRENNGKIPVALGNGATAARVSLEDKILVQIQVPQLKPARNSGFLL
jgi:hypothetical protein